MPTNLVLRMSTFSQALLSRNRKLRVETNPWSRTLGRLLLFLLVGLTCICLLGAWVNLKLTALNYEISRARETQKQLMEINRKLRVELSHLTSISRLEKLAESYAMGPPRPGQVVKLLQP
jgi:cell division protein FtsL|uniref:Cell division protein FtsL n=1 Tax=Desulfobacca acetoxidans TaxID=60893 RepID=A0A7C5AM13_9BACT